MTVHYVRPDQEARIRAGQFLSNGTAAILINGTRQVLLQHRDDLPSIRFPDYWSLPGGAIEPGETALTAIRRELQEELELNYAPEQIASYGQILDEPYRVLIDLFLARIDVPIDELRVHEGQGAAYFDPWRLPEKTTPHTRDVLKEYFTGSS